MFVTFDAVAQESTWRSSGVAMCLVGDFRFEAENVTDRMLVLSWQLSL